MILAHYILWRLAGYEGPVMIGYVIGMVAITWIVIEVVDRLAKRIKKKNKL